jgi:L-threonylcarbamoyladenylate synthase
LRSRIADLATRRIAVLAPPSYLDPSDSHVALAIAASTDADAYARSLYAHLHRMDASGADLLLVAEPPHGPSWEAVHDRLSRARAGAPAFPKPAQRL